MPKVSVISWHRVRGGKCSQFLPKITTWCETVTGRISACKPQRPVNKRSSIKMNNESKGYHKDWHVAGNPGCRQQNKAAKAQNLEKCSFLTLGAQDETPTFEVETPNLDLYSFVKFSSKLPAKPNRNSKYQWVPIIILIIFGWTDGKIKFL